MVERRGKPRGLPIRSLDLSVGRLPLLNSVDFSATLLTDSPRNPVNPLAPVRKPIPRLLHRIHHTTNIPTITKMTRMAMAGPTKTIDPLPTPPLSREGDERVPNGSLRIESVKSLERVLYNQGCITNSSKLLTDLQALAWVVCSRRGCPPQHSSTCPPSRMLWSLRCSAGSRPAGS